MSDQTRPDLRGALQLLDPAADAHASPGPPHDPALPAWRHYRHPDAAARHAELVLDPLGEPYRVSVVAVAQFQAELGPDPGSYLQLRAETHVLWALAEVHGALAGLAGPELAALCRRAIRGDQALLAQLAPLADSAPAPEASR